MKTDDMDLLENIAWLKFDPCSYVPYGWYFQAEDIRQLKCDTMYFFFSVNVDFQFKLSDVCIVVWGRDKQTKQIFF